MFVIETLVCVLVVSLFAEAVPVVFKEKTPNGEAIVAISSSDPNVEKYFTQQFSTRSGFTQLNSEDQDRLNNPGQRPTGGVHSSYSIASPGKATAATGAGRSFASASSGGFTQFNSEEQDRLNNPGQRPQGGVHSSYSIASPGKATAAAGAGRSFASASSGPFLPIFAYPIAHDSFGFDNFDFNDWVRNFESFYNPTFAGNDRVNSVAAVNDNGHIYGHVNSVAFDNRAKSAENSQPAQKTETIDTSGKVKPAFAKKSRNLAGFDSESQVNTYY